MFTEDELLPISALQHLAFCPRQWALIHLEGQWADNRLTAEGSLDHERAHGGEAESRDLIKETETLISRLHELTKSAETPEAHYSSKCRSCSLLDICLPKIARSQKSVDSYVERATRMPEGTSETTT